MKRILIIALLPLLFLSCDKVEDGVVDPNEEEFIVKVISAPSEIIYSQGDSTLLTVISLTNTESVKEVWFELTSEDGMIETKSVTMSVEDVNNSSYSGTTNFSIQDPTGMYVIEYFVKTITQNSKKLASHSFYYDNTRNVTFENLTAPELLIYSEDDPYLHTSIILSNTYNLRNVWINIKSSDSQVIIADSLQLLRMPNGSPYHITTYYDSLKMSPNYPDGNYIIDYYIKTNVSNKEKIATHEFSFEGEGVNTPPIISNALFYYEDEEPVLRDTLENNRPFIFSVYVTDDNGLSDIDSVYADFYSPNNPSAFRVLMYDDGDEAHGDLVAGDGTYSFKNIFQNAQGERKFEFWARDRAGELSNMITHNVVVE
ncbi:MAG: hypothetical protein ABFS12_17510 [Bacteroidota bacterium]